MPAPVNEPAALEAALAPAPEGCQWLALHARPRCEKKVAEFCRQQGAPSFLPLLRQEHRYGKRVRVHTRPFFTGYLFAVAAPAQIQLLAQNRHVANVLPVFAEEAFLAQMRAVRQALLAGATVDLMPSLREGKPVRVAGGPLKGIEGLVLRWKGRDRVVVNVDLIGYAMAVEVDAALLRSLD